MTEREPESTDAETKRSTDENEQTDGLDRRSMLKGTAVAGLAGAGLAGNASAEAWREITFCAAGADLFSYRLVTTGDVRRGGTYQSDKDDVIRDGTVDGAVSQGRCDSFLFTGEVAELDLSGPGTVSIDGKVVRDTTKKRLPNTITIKADDSFAEYKFRVSGRVERGDRAEPAPDDQIIDGNVVRGGVGGQGVDNYHYSGSLCFDRATAPVTVTLDINPD